MAYTDEVALHDHGNRLAIHLATESRSCSARLGSISAPVTATSTGKSATRLALPMVGSRTASPDTGARIFCAATDIGNGVEYRWLSTLVDVRNVKTGCLSVGRHGVIEGLIGGQICHTSEFALHRGLNCLLCLAQAGVGRGKRPFRSECRLRKQLQISLSHVPTTKHLFATGAVCARD
ncbi:hypothetical protein ACTMU2_13885 [Cupriavidus basilensis]